MNEKKMDEMLRQLGQKKTEVPDFFSKGLTDTLNNLPEPPVAIPLRSKNSRWLYVAGAVAVTTMCVIGSGFVSPAMAQVLREVPLIGSVFEKTGDPILKDMSERGLTSQPQKTAADKGVEMTITDVFYDGSRLAIGYKLKSQNNQPLKASSDPMPLQWKIGVKETDQIQWIGDAKEVAHDNREYAGKIDLNFEIQEKSLENFTLQLDVEAIHGVAGNWNFILPISTKKTAKASTTFRPMVTKEWNGTMYTVERVTFSPATTQVIVKRTVPKEKMNDFYYIGYDEYMTRMPGGPSSGSAPKDEGNGMVTITDTLKFSAMKDIPKQITIEALIPRQLDETGNRSMKEYVFDAKGKFPVTIPLGGDNSITVQEIEFLSDKTMVKYEVKGNPIFQGHRFMLEDGAGKVHSMEGRNPVRITKDRMLFACEFPKIDPSGSVKLKTRVDETEGTSRQFTFITVPLTEKK